AVVTLITDANHGEQTVLTGDPPALRADVKTAVDQAFSHAAPMLQESVEGLRGVQRMFNSSHLQGLGFEACFCSVFVLPVLQGF
ncbi:hypothetical protein QTP86_022737, partial [Hemibagrus guttatus]